MMNLFPFQIELCMRLRDWTVSNDLRCFCAGHIWKQYWFSTKSSECCGVQHSDVYHLRNWVSCHNQSQLGVNDFMRYTYLNSTFCWLNCISVAWNLKGPIIIGYLLHFCDIQYVYLHFVHFAINVLTVMPVTYSLIVDILEDL